MGILIGLGVGLLITLFGTEYAIHREKEVREEALAEARESIIIKDVTITSDGKKLGMSHFARDIQ